MPTRVVGVHPVHELGCFVDKLPTRLPGRPARSNGVVDGAHRSASGAVRHGRLRAGSRQDDGGDGSRHAGQHEWDLPHHCSWESSVGARGSWVSRRALRRFTRRCFQ